MKKQKSSVTYPKNYLENVSKEKKPLIYDCFTFYNELDLLEIRLQEIATNVDYIVLAEATKTFSGKTKPLHFKKHKKRFKKWEHKIIHIIVDDMPEITPIDKFFIWLEKNLPRKLQLFVRKFLARIIGGVARYKMIEYQRRCLLRGLTHAKEEDIILGVDVDEIPRPEALKKLPEALKKYRYIEFEQENFKYSLNGKVVGEEALSPGTRACKLKTLKKELRDKIDFLRTTPYLWRKFNPKDYGKQNYYTIKDAGWHFSYIGDVQTIMEKFTNVSHPEVDKKELKDPKIVSKMIQEGKVAASNATITYVPITKKFPKTIVTNKKLYHQKKLIR